MARRSFSPGALTAPVPAVLVSVGDMENSNILTIGWTGILATSPPKTYISVRPARHSHGIIERTGEFVINLTTDTLAYATDYAGIYTGAKVDKFEKLSLTKCKSEKVAAPTVAESPLSLECKVCDVWHMGTHDVFVADIVNVSCDESILDEAGKIRLDRAGLIAYAHGEYYKLGEVIGKFGFSTAKKKAAQGGRKNAPLQHGKSLSDDGKDGRDGTQRPFYLSAPGYKKRARKKGGK